MTNGNFILFLISLIIVIDIEFIMYKILWYILYGV